MGCKIERAWHLLSLLLGIGCGPQLLAQEQAVPPLAPPADVQWGVVQEEVPSIEFLEFLGQWETEEGEWIAPEDLADEEFAQLLDTEFESEIEDSD